MSLRSRRLALGLTQRDLGHAAGLLEPGVQAKVSLAERGDYPRLVPILDRTLAAIEGTRPRDHRLRDRRRALHLSLPELGELAGFEVGRAGAGIVERAEAGHASPGDVQTIRRALVWLEGTGRRERERARQATARIAWQRKLWAAAMTAAGGAGAALEVAIASHMVALLHDGDGAGFDILAEWLPEAIADAAGSDYLDQVTPVLGDKACADSSPAPVHGIPAR